MRKVSIQTAQNVLIDFQVATLGQRILAYLLDLVVIGVGAAIIAFFLVSFFGDFQYLILILFAFYTPASEILMNGQTLGKKAMKLRVVNVKGKEPTGLDYIIRWAFRLIDLYLSAYSVAVILISTSARSQRLGGILSNTMVVSMSGEMDLSLKDILRIDDRSKYTPQYEQVYRFSEDEMLTIKTVLDRYQKYRNPAHAELLNAAAERCANVLSLNQKPTNAHKFLKTVLRDYIVITRS